jgi:hypothetical protein
MKHPKWENELHHRQQIGLTLICRKKRTIYVPSICPGEDMSEPPLADETLALSESVSLSSADACTGADLALSNAHYSPHSHGGLTTPFSHFGCFICRKKRTIYVPSICPGEDMSEPPLADTRKWPQKSIVKPPCRKSIPSEHALRASVSSASGE